MKVSALFPGIMALAAVLMAAVGHASVVERPLSPVSFPATVSEAHTVANRHSEMKVLRIAGDSMLPFFGDGSVVIVKKIVPAQLRAGMVVVYTNRFGETVAHRLIASSNEGWVAQGFNNAETDSTRVTQENLVGVVYATFHSNGLTPPAGNIAGLLHSTPVALAAPAK